MERGTSFLPWGKNFILLLPMSQFFHCLHRNRKIKVYSGLSSFLPLSLWWLLWVDGEELFTSSSTILSSFAFWGIKQLQGYYRPQELLLLLVQPFSKLKGELKVSGPWGEDSKLRILLRVVIQEDIWERNFLQMGHSCTHGVERMGVERTCVLVHLALD